MTRAIAVYTGTDVAQLQLIAPGHGEAAFLAEEGMIYHFQVDSKEGGFGDFWLALHLAPCEPATNDYFSNAMPCAGGVGYSAGWIEMASSEPGEPEHIGGLPCKSLWWRWQVPRNGRVPIGNAGSLATNLLFAVYTGSCVSVSIEPVFGGTTYSIAVFATEAASGDASFYFQNSAPFEGTPAFIVPGNVLKEASFEGTALGLTHWQASFGFGGYVGEPGGADGTTWIVMNAGSCGWRRSSPRSRTGITRSGSLSVRTLAQLRVWWLSDGMENCRRIGSR